ncbi:MAG: radical SAM protein, partial [bacterium]
MSGSIREAEEIAEAFGLTRAQASVVISRYPALVNPYFRRLAGEAGEPLLLQVRPDPAEISPLNDSLPEDPIGEESFSPVPNLTHRYPDRVLFLVSDRCAVTCRFCTRKRKVGRGLRVTPETVREGLRYIAGDGRIRDVLLSGGDPLMLEDDCIEDILSRLRGMDHVEILRVGTRIPAALPQRVTPELAAALSRHRPLYVHVHFNHPAEITPEAVMACDLLADAGIPMSSQTVLLAGV